MNDLVIKDILDNYNMEESISVSRLRNKSNPEVQYMALLSEDDTDQMDIGIALKLLADWMVCAFMQAKEKISPDDFNNMVKTIINRIVIWTINKEYTDSDIHKWIVEQSKGR